LLIKRGFCATIKIIMRTFIKKPDLDTFAEARRLILAGDAVAFPTETVYGLGCNAFSEQACKNVFAAKGRPADNPLIIHICDKKQIRELALDIGEKTERLIAFFMPGALTIVLKKGATLALSATAGLDTVAIRMPKNEVAAAFIKACGVPIAAPSANTSTRPSATNAAAVYEDLNGKIPLIIDGGECKIGIESTVIDMTTDRPAILREGSVTKERIERLIGSVDTVSAISGGGAPRPPGQKYRHYAPACRVYIAANDAAKINGLAVELKAAGRQPVALTNGAVRTVSQCAAVYLGSTAPEASHRLYGALREAEKKADCIIIADVPYTEDYRHIKSRIEKICGETE
jgi:L-threonylcarbamoyladenylate synthase